MLPETAIIIYSKVYSRAIKFSITVWNSNAREPGSLANLVIAGIYSRDAAEKKGKNNENRNYF